jgi:8-oxo-dGTP diphosphatase
MAKVQGGLRVVHAAGGVIYRRHARGHLEVLLIHRPHRRDWTFPKGKLEPGESHRSCALREVEEETGLRCVIEAALPSTTHVDRKGRLKIVRYWVMSHVAGSAEPRNEVDEVLWVSLHRAPARLTYARDRDLLEAFALAFG